MESIDCKLVVFTDSQSCASCAAKHLADWEYLLDRMLSQYLFSILLTLSATILDANYDITFHFLFM